MPLIQKSDQPYGTGFIIALEVDEKFLDVESHSLFRLC